MADAFINNAQAPRGKPQPRVVIPDQLKFSLPLPDSSQTSEQSDVEQSTLQERIAQLAEQRLKTREPQHRTQLTNRSASATRVNKLSKHRPVATRTKSSTTPKPAWNDDVKAPPLFSKIPKIMSPRHKRSPTKSGSTLRFPKRQANSPHSPFQRQQQEYLYELQRKRLLQLEAAHRQAMDTIARYARAVHEASAASPAFHRDLQRVHTQLYDLLAQLHTNPAVGSIPPLQPALPGRRQRSQAIPSNLHEFNAAHATRHHPNSGTLDGIQSAISDLASVLAGIDHSPNDSADYDVSFYHEQLAKLQSLHQQLKRWQQIQITQPLADMAEPGDDRGDESMTSISEQSGVGNANNAAFRTDELPPMRYEHMSQDSIREHAFPLDDAHAEDSRLQHRSNMEDEAVQVDLTAAIPTAGVNNAMPKQPPRNEVVFYPATVSEQRPEMSGQPQRDVSEPPRGQRKSPSSTLLSKYSASFVLKHAGQVAEMLADELVEEGIYAFYRQMEGNTAPKPAFMMRDAKPVISIPPLVVGDPEARSSMRPTVDLYAVLAEMTKLESAEQELVKEIQSLTESEKDSGDIDRAIADSSRDGTLSTAHSRMLTAEEITAEIKTIHEITGEKPEDSAVEDWLVRRVRENLKRFERYLRMTDKHWSVGNVDNWRIIEIMADDIIEDALTSVAVELFQYGDEFVDHLIRLEFDLDGNSASAATAGKV